MANVNTSGTYRRVQLPQPQVPTMDFEAARRRMKAQEEAARLRAAQTAMTPTGFPISKPETVKKSLQEKILSVTGGNILGRGLGLGIAQGGTKKVTDEIQAGETEMQRKLIERIRVARTEGRDTTRLKNALSALTGGIEDTGNSANDMYTEGITSKQVIGDALQLSATAATGFKPASSGYQTGSLAIKGKASAGAASLLTKAGVSSNPVTKSAVTGTSGIGRGMLQGAKAGAIEGVGFGAATGFSQGLKSDKSIGDSIKQGAIGGATGGITGGVLGGIIGGISGGINGYKLRSSIYKAQETNGLRPDLSTTIRTKVAENPKYGAFIKEAQKQGFKDGDINFLATISKNDKPTLKKMFDLTVKAQNDPRQIVRAGDVLGESVTKQVEQVVKLNKQAGVAVDTTAKTLRGQPVDLTDLGDVIKKDFENLGIGIFDDGTLDFSQSVFKNTPSVQKEIQKVIRTVPDGSDAYQAHIFKKSLDEVLDFGTSGEGLKGQAERLLKSWRNATDRLLDTQYPSYNLANTKYKETIDYISAAKAMVGRKVDLTSKEGAQAFGQALRSAFSNNKSRPNTLKFIEDTHEISKALGLEGAEKNLLDQALFVNMLEETFGSEAATGLAGEVSKAINASRNVTDVIRDPIGGGLNLLAKGIEKAQNVSPERKKQILKLFIR